jgi:hypothetical protein
MCQRNMTNGSLKHQLTVIDIDQYLWRNVCSPFQFTSDNLLLVMFHWQFNEPYISGVPNESSGIKALAPPSTDKILWGLGDSGC